jgi:NADH dehydrogenase
VRPLPRVVIIGGGFGGLQCARKLRNEPVDVTLVDRRNYHLFTPLIYQVASCLLNPSEIAVPLRKIFRGVPNVRYREGEVVEVDLVNQQVHLADGHTLDYDYVVIATGSETNYYGNSDVEKHSLGLNDLPEALQLRNHVLECLERAAMASDPDERKRLLTFCIVGGGPTGVEYAGALAELVRLVLPHEYPEIPPGDVQIVLLEGSGRLISTFPPRLSAYAKHQLERMGVEVRTHTFIASADDNGAVTRTGIAIKTATIVWTAGVLAEDLSVRPDAARDRQRRYLVDEHLRIAGARGAFAIGDAAAARGKRESELPMVAPPAMQEGRYVARQILHGPSRRGFHYFDKGILATIGRRAGVGKIGPVGFTGFLGWIAWLFVHLYYLIGFGNRTRVFLRFAWYYLRLDRPVRIILEADGDDGHRE